MKNILAILLFAPALAFASEGGYRLDRAPNDPRDLVSLQSGARTYMNYCLGCHGMQFMRYDGLKEIGLSEAQIKDNLMFTADKVGEPMRIAFNPKDAKSWFGVAPPDLSVIARSRGADWLYTYLRTFYRDPKTVTGWNNAVFPNVGMPHALWTLQGQRGLEVESKKEGGAGSREFPGLRERAARQQPSSDRHHRALCARHCVRVCLASEEGILERREVAGRPRGAQESGLKP
jgi:ubiquinol-cytochrome c reductase cytochrome c1 subunit